MTTDTRTAPSPRRGRVGQTVATLLGFGTLTLVPVAIVTLVALGGAFDPTTGTAASVLLVVGGSFAGVGPILAAAAVAALPAPPTDQRVRRQVIGWGIASASASAVAIATAGVAAALEPALTWVAGSIALVALVMTALAVAVGTALRHLLDRHVAATPAPTARELADLRRRRVRRSVIGAIIGTSLSTLGIGALVAFSDAEDGGPGGTAFTDVLQLAVWLLFGAVFGALFGSFIGSFAFSRRVQSALGPDIAARTRITKWLMGKRVELDDAKRTIGIDAAPLLLHQQQWAIVQQLLLGVGVVLNQVNTLIGPSGIEFDWFPVGFIVLIVVLWPVLVSLMVRQTRRIRSRIDAATPELA